MLTEVKCLSWAKLFCRACTRSVTRTDPGEYWTHMKEGRCISSLRVRDTVFCHSQKNCTRRPDNAGQGGPPIIHTQSTRPSPCNSMEAYPILLSPSITWYIMLVLRSTHSGPDGAQALGKKSGIIGLGILLYFTSLRVASSCLASTFPRRDRVLASDLACRVSSAQGSSMFLYQL